MKRTFHLEPRLWKAEPDVPIELRSSAADQPDEDIGLHRNGLIPF